MVIYGFLSYYYITPPKLLTTAKNKLYLKNGRNRRRRKFPASIYNNDYERDFILSKISRREKRIRKQQKKADDSKITDTTYQLLNKHVFKPLRENIVEVRSTTYSRIPVIEFDPLKVHKDNNDYYEEGFKHLIQDIDNFEIDLIGWKSKL